MKKNFTFHIVIIPLPETFLLFLHLFYTRIVDSSIRIKKKFCKNSLVDSAVVSFVGSLSSQEGRLSSKAIQNRDEPSKVAEEGRASVSEKKKMKKKEKEEEREIDGREVETHCEKK